MKFGYQKFVEFDNGYTASVVCNDASYGSDRGLFEIAILYNDDIVYDTGLTEDVIGFLDFDGVIQTLDNIRKLPRRKPL
jgi:hypothetical protein